MLEIGFGSLSFGRLCRIMMNIDSINGSHDAFRHEWTGDLGFLEITNKARVRGCLLIRIIPTCGHGLARVHKRRVLTWSNRSLLAWSESYWNLRVSLVIVNHVLVIDSGSLYLLSIIRGEVWTIQSACRCGLLSCISNNRFWCFIAIRSISLKGVCLRNNHLLNISCLCWNSLLI